MTFFMTLFGSSSVWRWLTLLTYFSLFFLLLAKLCWLAPPRHVSPALALLVQVGPLLLPLRGLLYARVSTHTLTSLLALYYFVWGVFEFSGGDYPQLSSTEILLSVLLFATALGYVRSRRMQQQVIVE